jgi:hypothetical protein
VGTEEEDGDYDDAGDDDAELKREKNTHAAVKMQT